MHKEVYRYLRSKGYKCEINEKDECVYCNCIISKKDITFKIVFPNEFPAKYVEIFIDDDSKKGILIPHIYKGGKLCLYDEDESNPNTIFYKEEVENTIQRAIKLIDDSINLRNLEDFRKEIVTRWEQNAKIKADVIFQPINSPKILYAAGGKTYLVIAETKKKLSDYIKYTKGIDADINIKKVLYIPLDDIELILPPRDINDIVKRMDETKYGKFYYNYVASNTEDPIIIISQIINTERILLGIRQPSIKSSLVKINNKTIKSILIFQKDKEVKRIKFNNFTRKRIFTRGGDGKITENKNIVVVGCGSIGSMLTKAIIDVGISSTISLIDNDILNSENIGRHVCGASEVGLYKTTAMRNEILRHYPDTELVLINKDINDILENDIDILNRNDYIFIVVGNITIEKKIISLLEDGKIIKPTIIMWVEPYLIAGHAIICRKKIDKNTINSILDSSENFKISVLKESWKYLKSESGCQSAYAPYSGFEAQQFINSFIDTFNKNFIEKKIQGNYIYTKIGRIKWARKNKMKIAADWIAKNDRYEKFVRIDNNEDI
ncbi:ThiF family adenylyltransferase [Clostridium beijerinckii]|uniref:ThiF family adenylyltransferase n=1 Tax=Clostridium beijerinckii TaxID=1520 RepID=UPI00047BC078|nr:ThiF family adenylyltransferase [Clostridium beijerinckii]